MMVMVMRVVMCMVVFMGGDGSVDGEYGDGGECDECEDGDEGGIRP